MSHDRPALEKKWEQLVPSLDGVSDHGGGYPVALWKHNGRLVVVATNQGGHDSTAIDLHDLLSWLGVDPSETNLVSRGLPS